MMASVLLGSAYLGPVEYFQKIVNSSHIVVEQHDNYIKQTYRTRCDIATANGKSSLTIPVVKGRDVKKAMKDVQIAYHQDWQSNHLKALVAAYKSSPYFEYYIDDLLPFYEKKWTFLVEFNQELLGVILSNIEGEFSVNLSSDYGEPHCQQDFREIIHPKKDYRVLDPEFVVKPYRQVFESKLGFLPNLSIVDLLFNKGPEAIFYLRTDAVT